MQHNSDFEKAMAWRSEVLRQGLHRVVVLHDAQNAFGGMLKSVLARSGVMVLSPGRDDAAWLEAVAEEARGAAGLSGEPVERFARMMNDGIEHGVEAVLVVWPALLPLVEQVELGVPVIEVEA